MCNIIFIFGPSCSGKSTLGKALHDTLGSEWTYIDRDILIEANECTDETANQKLDEKIQSIRNKIIIDAQIPWREPRQDELYFLLHPPLDVLLKRDAQRTIDFKRTETRARYAREYVVKTHTALNELYRKTPDWHFDSSLDPVSVKVDKIKSIL